VTQLVFTVLQGPWTAGEHGTFTDTVTVEKPAKDLVRLAGHAHAAGVLDVTEGLDLKTVQSQADGEKAYAKAQDDGSWHEGNQIQHDLDQARAGEIEADVA
jgi:hypothetical protein